MRFTPVMLALLLALSPGAVAVQASAPTASAPVESTSAVDGLPDNDSVSGNVTVTGLGTTPSRTAFDSLSLALGSSLAMDRGELGTAIGVESLERQLDDAEAVEDKKRILNRYRYRIENRIISLKAKEQQATRAFSNGTISANEYVRTVGMIHSETEEIRRLVETMRTNAKSIPNFLMKVEANTLTGKLVTLQGPIRERIAQTIRGQAPPARIYVETADTGIVLSTIADGTYVREIIRTDRRNPGATGESSKRAAQDAVIDRYGWVWNNSSGSAISANYGTTNVYRMRLTHTNGRLVVYYDSGTKSVFKEIHHRNLYGPRPLSTGPVVANTTTSTFGPNLTLAVNRTYPGGPLRVRLTNATGAPLQAEVTVGGDSVGRTNANGVLWTLGPADRFRVSATYDDATVNVTTTPVEP